MGKSELKNEGFVINKDNADILLTSSLVSQIQDQMMAVAKRFEDITPEISIMELLRSNDRMVGLNTYSYDWEKKEWKEPVKEIEVDKEFEVDDKQYRWNLCVCGVTLSSTMTYRTFESAADVALYWEEIED